MGYIGYSSIGPFFLPGKLTGDIYPDLLPNAFGLALTFIIEKNHAYNKEEEIFQQDEDPPN